MAIKRNWTQRFIRKLWPSVSQKLARLLKSPASKHDKCMRTGVLITAIAATGLMWAQPAPRPTGYLNKADMPDVVRIVPPAPANGDNRFNADMAIFHSTRALEGSPRWTLAQADDDVSVPGLFKAFSCSLGITLTRDNAPKTNALITRANQDSSVASNILKQLYQHKRPFQVDDANVCLSAQGKAALEKSPDYPSGHTTGGWETGLVLSELAPDAATAILARARAFGQIALSAAFHTLVLWKRVG